MEKELNMSPLVENKKQRNYSIDLVRYICAILVLWIHTSPLSSFSDTANGIVLNTLTRIAVPFFFIVSGYYYIQKLERGDKKVFFNYISKLIITYLLWSFIYGFIIFFNTANINPVPFLKDRIKEFFIDGSFYHLWFFPALIVSVCVTTLFYKLKLKKLLIPIALVLYCVGAIGCGYVNVFRGVPWLSEFLSSSTFNVIRRFFLMGFPFFVAGSILEKVYQKVKDKENKKLMVAGLVILAVWLLESLIVFFMKLGSVLTFTLYPLVIMLLVLLLKNPYSKGEKIAAPCRAMANFLYYAHPALLFVLSYFGFDQSAIINFTVVLIVASICGWLLHKWRKVKIFNMLIN